MTPLAVGCLDTGRDGGRDGRGGHDGGFGSTDGGPDGVSCDDMRDPEAVAASSGRVVGEEGVEEGVLEGSLGVREGGVVGSQPRQQCQDPSPAPGLGLGLGQAWFPHAIGFVPDVKPLHALPTHIDGRNVW